MTTTTSIRWAAAVAVLVFINAPLAAGTGDVEPEDAVDSVRQEVRGLATAARQQIDGALGDDEESQGGNQGSSSEEQAEPEPDDGYESIAAGVLVRIHELPEDADATTAPARPQAGGVWGAIESILAGALSMLFGSDDAKAAHPAPLATAGAYAAKAVSTPAAILLLALGGVTASLGGSWYGLRRFAPAVFFPLLSRIAKSELYENDARRLVADLVENDPGACLNEIVERTGYSRNAISYHLFVLEKEEIIVSVKDGKYRRYFKRGGKYVNGAKDVVSVLRNEVSLQIAQMVRDKPGAIQREVCHELGTTASAACWHAKRLERTGVLRKERHANTVRYFLGPAVDKYDLTAFGLAAA